MIDSANLMSVRTVEDVVIYDETGQPKEILGTKVGDDVLSTDRDTLFPLQGALGYEVTQSLFVGKNTLLVEGPSDFLYLTAFSAELRKKGRSHLDLRWTITPAGGADKVAAFMSLFGGNKLHVAVLLDYAHGQKKKVEDLRRSKLLQDNHVLTFDMFTGKPEADIEDVVGWENYLQLVNSSFALNGTRLLIDPEATDQRVVKKVEERFRTMPPSTPEFDHYIPAEYLIKNQDAALAALPNLDAALDRFEALFKKLNEMLPQTS